MIVSFPSGHQTQEELTLGSLFCEREINHNAFWPKLSIQTKFFTSLFKKKDTKRKRDKFAKFA
jgi:hypothetical protein